MKKCISEISTFHITICTLWPEPDEAALKHITTTPDNRV